jgi:hypothetical protein
MARTPAVFAAAALLSGAAASAEEPRELGTGMRLRVTTSGAGGFSGTFEGTLAKIGAEDLTLVDADRGAVMTVPASSVTRVQVSSGKRRRVRKGMLIGSAAGAALGALAGSGALGTENGCSLDYPYVYEPCTASTAIRWAGLTALGGAMWGAVIGYHVRSETWTDSSL